MQKIIRLDTVDSTNTYLKALVSQGACPGTVVIAEAQTAGRGRFGRSFFSPKGSGIYMSVYLRPETDKLTLITTAAAVALRRSIKNSSGADTDIKWINDIYKDGKKLCGILAEGVNGGVIVGIGVNFGKFSQPLPEDIADSATYLADRDTPELKEKLINEIIINLTEVSENLRDPGILEEYRKYSTVIGKTVEYTINNEKSEALAIGIDGDGALIIKDRSGRIATLTSGSVTVKN